MKRVVKRDQVDWLLERDNPSVRYYTLTDILGRPKTDEEVARARAEIMERGVVSKIMAKQKKQGCWEEPERFYTAKYKGTAWQLISRVSRPKWLRLGFPLMYQTDILEILDILTGLGSRDDRMQEAVDRVVSKQDDQGRWLLEETFNGRFQTNIEQKGKPSKWVTLNALRVLKRLDFFQPYQKD